MSRATVLNAAWQLGFDPEAVAQATADADRVYFVELRDKNGDPIDLAAILPAGWATSQDMSTPAKAASALAWRTDVYELAKAHEPILLSRAGRGVRPRYLAHVDLREKATGKVRRFGAAHSPLLTTGRKAEWRRRLARFLAAHPGAEVGGDGNTRDMRRLSKALGRRVVGREVMFIALPVGATATISTLRTRGSDHPILRADVRAPVHKEKPVSKVEIYPGANATVAWHADDHPGRRFDANCGCLHTTEGTSRPDYGGGATAPNITAVPDMAAKRLRWVQHFPIDMSSRALKNLEGGVETNTLNVVQVELVGTCNPKHRRSWDGAGKLLAGRDYIYWPDAPDWALRDLAAFMRWCNTEHGIPLEGPADWVRYPDSYGFHAEQRFTNAEWSAFKGWCGHQHVPENDHGDPGNIAFARLLEFARGATSPAPRPTPLPETELSQERARLTAWRKRLGASRPRVRAAIDAFLKGTPKR